MERTSHFHPRFICIIIACINFSTNVTLAYSTEKNFWAERRRLREGANSLILASLSSGAPRISLEKDLPPLEKTTGSLSADLARTLPRGLLSENTDILGALQSAHGTIRKVSIPPSGHGKRLVIHIQDVHQNEDAQRHIDETIRSILNTQKAGLVALEGAFEPIHVERYNDFKDRQVIDLTADCLLRENLITGTVHAAITTQTPLPPLLGVDDEARYNSNVSAYRRSVPKMEAFKADITRRKMSLENAKKSAFSPELTAFDLDVTAYREKRLSLVDYATALVPPQGVGQVGLLLQALAMEKTLNFDSLESARKEFIDALVKRLNQAQIARLIQESSGYRLGQIRYGEFYRALQRHCQEANLDLAAFPQMDGYIRYVLLSDRIDAEKLMDELATLEKEKYNRLAGTAEEKALVAQSTYLHLTARLLDFALTPQEWAEYENQRHEEPLDLNSFEDFYREANLRDEAMARNLLKSMEEREVDTAVLVTGGYHSLGMDHRLAQAGVTVVSFTPRIEKADGGDGAYLSIFTQEKTPLEKLFAGEKLFISQHPGSKITLEVTGPVLAAGIDGILHGSPKTAEGVFASLGDRMARVSVTLAERVALVNVALQGIQKTVLTRVQRVPKGFSFTQTSIAPRWATLSLAGASISATIRQSLRTLFFKTQPQRTRGGLPLGETWTPRLRNILRLSAFFLTAFSGFVFAQGGFEWTWGGILLDQFWPLFGVSGVFALFVFSNHRFRNDGAIPMGVPRPGDRNKITLKPGPMDTPPIERMRRHVSETAPWTNSWSNKRNDLIYFFGNRRYMNFIDRLLSREYRPGDGSSVLAEAFTLDAELENLLVDTLKLKKEISRSKKDPMDFYARLDELRARFNKYLAPYHLTTQTMVQYADPSKKLHPLGFAFQVFDIVSTETVSLLTTPTQAPLSRRFHFLKALHRSSSFASLGRRDGPDDNIFLDDTRSRVEGRLRFALDPEARLSDWQFGLGEPMTEKTILALEKVQHFFNDREKKVLTEMADRVRHMQRVISRFQHQNSKIPVTLFPVTNERYLRVLYSQIDREEKRFPFLRSFVESTLVPQYQKLQAMAEEHGELLARAKKPIDAMAPMVKQYFLEELSQAEPLTWAQAGGPSMVFVQGEDTFRTLLRSFDATVQNLRSSVPMGTDEPLTEETLNKIELAYRQIPGHPLGADFMDRLRRANGARGLSMEKNRKSFHQLLDAANFLEARAAATRQLWASFLGSERLPKGDSEWARNSRLALNSRVVTAEVAFTSPTPQTTAATYILRASRSGDGVEEGLTFSQTLAWGANGDRKATREPLNPIQMAASIQTLNQKNFRFTLQRAVLRREIPSPLRLNPDSTDSQNESVLGTWWRSKVLGHLLFLSLAGLVGSALGADLTMLSEHGALSLAFAVISWPVSVFLTATGSLAAMVESPALNKDIESWILSHPGVVKGSQKYQFLMEAGRSIREARTQGGYGAEIRAHNRWNLVHYQRSVAAFFQLFRNAVLPLRKGGMTKPDFRGRGAADAREFLASVQDPTLLAKAVFPELEVFTDFDNNPQGVKILRRAPAFVETMARFGADENQRDYGMAFQESLAQKGKEPPTRFRNEGVLSVLRLLLGGVTNDFQLFNTERDAPWVWDRTVSSQEEINEVVRFADTIQKANAVIRRQGGQGIHLTLTASGNVTKENIENALGHVDPSMIYVKDLALVQGTVGFQEYRAELEKAFRQFGISDPKSVRLFVMNKPPIGYLSMDQLRTWAAQGGPDDLRQVLAQALIDTLTSDWQMALPAWDDLMKAAVFISTNA